MKDMRSMVFVSLLAAILATGKARAADAPAPPAFTFEFHGFVVGSLYTQNQTFLSGQGDGILIASPPPGAHLPISGVSTTKSGMFMGGDVRQLRPIFVLKGPEAWKAKPKAHLEFDLFGNPSPGALGYESPTIRLRQAYGELNWGHTVFDAGQHSAQILLAQIPTTVAHITNPVPYGAGLIGWRTIGFRGFHTIPVGPEAKIELGAEIADGKWADANAAGTVFPGNTPNTIPLAWASNTPQFVGRVKADGKTGALTWMGWVAGSYEAVNLKGFGNTVSPNGFTLQNGTVRTSLTSYAVTAGGNLTFVPLTLMFEVYTGHATAPMIGSMLQFGDIPDVGGFAQVGFFATKKISVWAIAGMSSLDKKDLQNWANPTGVDLTLTSTATPSTATTLRDRNVMYGGMVRFMDAGYALGLEGYGYQTRYLLGNLANDRGTKTTSAYQIVASGGYFF